MAGADRMTIEEVVRKVLLDEHADVIREAVKAVAAELMELEVSELIGAEHGERRPEVPDEAEERRDVRREQLGGGILGDRAENSGAEHDPGQQLPDHGRLTQAGEQPPADPCTRDDHHECEQHGNAELLRRAGHTVTEAKRATSDTRAAARRPVR